MKEPEAEEKLLSFSTRHELLQILKTLREIPVPDGAVSEETTFGK